MCIFPCGFFRGLLLIFNLITFQEYLFMFVIQSFELKQICLIYYLFNSHENVCIYSAVLIFFLDFCGNCL